ncbi:carbohydrate ABC transporter substrate-binding protein [Phytoactinopolyspora alkaliphila]|uniref:Carbohydrate ABC transporter substrate-binding protein n=1 Tax=Phytoactinopolyspora alkaliphila TaxID=1783498 RepID=A0A6N9YS26_9ACTN|nr:ABC transporter substrate-binding protein [Phytoactinopolyspora alkaliphila]NED97774.1 carbohydrate ABC transporter substrate-binding protein [Phytoactinopolyspora alkaliphila]
MLALTARGWRQGAALIVAAGLLAATGCSGGDGGNSIADLDSAEADGGATDQQTMEADPGHEGEDVELEFWTFVDAHTDFMMARAEEFNEANSDYNIVLNASTADYEEMHDRLLIALQSGTGAPDIVDIEIQRFATFLRGEVPLHPLNDIVDNHRDQLVEERLAPYQSDGVEYGIDYHLGTWVMYYNNAILEEAGVDVDSIVTWDDYIEAGKQVVENTDAMMTSVETTDRFSVIGPMLQNGGGTYDENGEMILDSPENVEALQLISDMVHEHEIAVVSEGGMHHETAYYEAFNSGNYASVWMPQWYVTRFKDFMPETEGDILIRPMPEFEPDGFISTMGGGTGTAITTQIDEGKLDAAKQFLEFAKLTYDSQVALWTELGFDPFREDVYDDPALTEPDQWFGGEQVMTNLRDMFDRLAPEYTGPRYPEIILQLRDIVAYEVIQEGGSPQEALERAAQEIRSMD